MIGRARVILGTCSVAIVGIVVGVAAALAPDGGRIWLVSSGILAVLISIEAAVSDPRELTLALLLSLLPVVSLIASGAPSWFIAPSGTLLLFAGELNALSWDVQAARPFRSVEWRRLWHAAQLAVLGLAVALLVLAVASGPALSGTLTVALASTALVALAAAVFRRRT